MRNPSLGVALLALALGCGGNPDRPARLMDTGWFTGSVSYGPDSCAEKIGGFDPADGTNDWYWQDNPSLWVDAASTDAYWVELVDEAGVAAAASPNWSPEGLKLTFELDAPLQPATTYRWQASDCAAWHQAQFSTSDFGLPLTLDPADLVDRTWSLDLLGADWTEPAGAEALIQLYFSSPALLGVRYADDERIDLLGAPGDLDAFGVLTQASGATWDFPTADFTGSPFFEAVADTVVFQYDGVEIPIHDARLAGSFSADGLSIGGGQLSGLGDTRDLGAFLGGAQGDNPDAICDLAATLGVECTDCPDGGRYCLFLDAADIDGELVEGLTLQPRH